MARTGRPGLSQHQKKELWQRWKDGQSLSDIGRALGKHAASVFGVLLAKGGIAPRMRLRRVGSLSQSEREEISRSLVAGLSYCYIARLLDRAPSTISREVARNGSRKTYRALSAEANALQCSLRPKPCLLAKLPSLQRLVAEKLQCQWSPQQISGWLKVEHPGDKTM